MAKSKPAPAQPAAAGAAYQVVARRYRPQQFAELIGQEHVAGALENALKSGRVAHAYIFTGARGVGKTSAARILAKCINCFGADKPTATPCDQCDSCRAVMTGDDVDVLEIDGASNNKVDEVRELRQNVGFRPTRGRFKIYIIDEVHMLSTSAFNALLKTLEEPPEHVKFILATTEVERIPVTILSRCQRFDFAQVGPGKIFEQLKLIVQKEGRQADDDALRLVARRAGGSMRDSQSLLDQLLSSSSVRLTAEQVAAVLGTAGDDRVIDLAKAILRGDPKTALDLISAWVDQGLQIDELVDELVEYWRALMLVSCGGPEVRELPVSPNQLEAVKIQVAQTNLDTTLAALEVLTATKARMCGSGHTQVLLEMAVVRLCRLKDLLAVNQLLQLAVQPGAMLSAPAAPTASLPRANPAPQVLEPDAAKKNGELTGKQVENGSSNEVPTNFQLTEATLPEVWQRLQPFAQEKFPLLLKHLNCHSSYAISGPNSLVIRFPAAYSDSRKECEIEANAQRLANAFRHLTGQLVSLRFELDRSATAQPVNTGSRTAALPAPTEIKRSLASLPIFKRASELMGAQIWHVDDDFNPNAPPKPVINKTDEYEDETATDEG